MYLDNYCDLPTPHGTFRMYDTEDELFRVVTFGDIKKLKNQPLVRLHSSCIASEVFESRDCDCADQLRESMKAMAHSGSGIIFHLHQEGRGQGLSNKIKAVYKMQSEAMDTADSFDAMNLEQDTRTYEPAINLLKELGISSVKLISNNPRKQKALESAGITTDIVPTNPIVRPENEDYLKSKNEKLGHRLPIEREQDIHTNIYFYHSDQTWGEFSNFSKHAVFLQGKIWRTAEHFYQAQKFKALPLQEKVRAAESPMIAKEIANKLEPEHLQANWKSLKEEVMKQVLQAKFSQHPELKSLLLSTGESKIYEHSPTDSYWGDGEDGKGLNRLGCLLMELRDTLNHGAELKLCVG